MSEKTIENNKVSVIGKIVSDFTFSHEVFGEGFYLVDLEVNRLSDQADVIPLMVSERLVDVTENYQGCTVEAIGQFRSTTGMKAPETGWCFLYLSGRSILWRNLQIIQRRIRSFWRAISARRQSIGKLHLEERLQISCWR